MTLTGRRYPDAQYIAIHVEDGRVAGDEPIQVLPEEAGIQRWIMPGFFDMQVNGFAGKAFIDAGVTVEDVAHMARAILATGTTRFLPTVVTAAPAEMEHELSVIARAAEQDPLVAAMCPGVHVEGPFLNPEDGPRGAHPRAHVRPPDAAVVERLQEAAGGRIVLTTLAPEMPGAIELIAHLIGRDVLVALGHHRADAETLNAAIAAGARMSTHLGNACDAIMPRHDNVIWKQLGDDRLWASFIADGHHLPPKMLRCMLRAKTTRRSVLVTDAMSAAGMPAGTYRFGETSIEKLEDGKLVLPGTPFLAGASADMPTVISNAVRMGGAGLLEAVAMGSVRPAMLLARRHKDASARPGRWSAFAGDVANMVELDWDERQQAMRIRQVVCGQTAWVAAG
jgi:N-acetylglucosamine-6-phosphate deacetylase